MANIATAAAIAAKWARVTPQRSADYQSGIESPRADWETETTKANAAWKAGVQAAASQDLFLKGVKKAGTSKWQQNAIAKGPTRWSQGVQLAQGAFESAFAPFRDAIERTVLPPRFPRRDPRNLERVAAIVNALVKVKTG